VDGRAIPRRTLLLGALAGGALLAGCGRTGSKPDAAGAPPVGSQTAASPPRTTLSVALIGCGGHGRTLTKRLVADRRVVVSVVCDPDSQRAGSLADLVSRADRRRPVTSSDLRRALEDPGVDAVVVATPHHWHALAAIWALQAGKHVYLEKPATHSLAEGPALLSAWRDSDAVVQVGTQRRSHPGLQAAVGAVRDGEIGTIQHACCYSWKRRPSIGPAVRGSWPETLDPELWFGPRPVQRPTREQFHYDWHWFTGYGNGGLGNNGVHRLDVARWGMGLPLAPDRAFALGGRLGPEDAGQTPNTMLSVVAYGPRTVAHDLRGLPTKPDPGLDAGMLASDEVVFVGDGASIVVSRTGGRLVDDAGRVVTRYGGGDEDVDAISMHVRRFVSACLAGDRDDVAASLAEGVAAADMCHAPSALLRASAGTGRGPDPDAVRADVAELCGRAMDAPAGSFLAHVEGRSDLSLTSSTGVVAVSGDLGRGEFAYRDGFALPTA